MGSGIGANDGLGLGDGLGVGLVGVGYCCFGGYEDWREGERGERWLSVGERIRGFGPSVVSEGDVSMDVGGCAYCGRDRLLRWRCVARLGTSALPNWTQWVDRQPRCSADPPLLEGSGGTVF